MGSQYSKRYSEEFKRDAIALARSSDKTITEVARDLGVSAESLCGWVVKRDRIDRGGGMSGELTSAEREELKRLRRQNAEQQKTIEVPRGDMPEPRGCHGGFPGALCCLASQRRCWIHHSIHQKPKPTAPVPML
ncbi:transposase [Streptomyces sp. NPDC005336]|uniref:transposase n=1 Tax=Streptomyces sp. NPDC005336 TaxID=3157035 RepID=UPI0033B6B155